jgi:hypothetical protein
MQAGGAWTAVGIPGYTVNKVLVDPTCPTRVYAALGLVGARAAHRGGVQVSTDTGTSWTSLTPGTSLHQVPVADIDVDPTTNRYLFAASYGLGTWLYDFGHTLSCP